MGHKRKTLLLDFDGVCHPIGMQALDDRGFRLLLDNPRTFIWLPILERLLQATFDVEIIVSSDWAQFCDDTTLRHFLGGLASRFGGIVDRRHSGWSRAMEISHYVNEQGLNDWLALDDHSSVLDACFVDPRFVWCPPTLGMSDPSVQEKIAAWLSGLPIVSIPEDKT